MEETLPANLTNHYRNNRDHYSRINKRLHDTRKDFLSADRREQITMLQKSHSWAVISVQTPVDIHENAYSQLWDMEHQTHINIEDALSSVNYKNNKADYIFHSLTNDSLWGDVADMLERGEIDKAHRFILDEFKGVGPAKAPFVLAMLGFEEKMCVDTNMVQAFDLDGHVSTIVVEKYDSICQSLRDMTPTLRDMTTPFLWQWITFDYQRAETSNHDVFYNSL